MNHLVRAEQVIAESQIRETQRMETHAEKLRRLALLEAEAKLRTALTQEVFSKMLLSREMKLSTEQVDLLVRKEMLQAS